MKNFHKTFTFFKYICFVLKNKIKFWFDPLNPLFHPLFHPQFPSPFFVLVGCFFVCVLGERFVRTATQLCTTLPPLHSLSLSLSSFAAAAANTKQNKWRRVWWSAGSCCADLPLLLGPWAAFLSSFFSVYKFGERGYRLAGGVVLNRKKHLWGFDFENGWRDWDLPWSVSAGVSEDSGFFLFGGGLFSRWSQFCLLSFGENLGGVRRYGGGNCSRSDLMLAIYNKYVRFFGKVFLLSHLRCWRFSCSSGEEEESGQKNTYPFTICEFLFGNVLLRHLLC